MTDFTKYIDYIKNTGGSPSVIFFDDDWDPIGPLIRADMRAAGLIVEKDELIYLVEDKPDGENREED